MLHNYFNPSEIMLLRETVYRVRFAGDGIYPEIRQMDGFRNVSTLVGRLLIAWLFIPAGFAKIGGFAGSVGYATAMGLPLPSVSVAIGLAIELLGGIAVLIGWQTRIAAGLLALFTVVASVFFHAWWNLPADQQMMQQLMFNKNMAITGGLLVLAAWGAGAFSLDAKRGR